MTTTSQHLVATGISKHFGGVHALRDITLTIERGSVHAFVGENGAGKSTFGKLIAGLHSPDAGQLVVNGDSVQFHSSRDALRAGITIIGQERTVIPQRSVIENVFLGRESRSFGVVRGAGMRKRYAELCEQSGFSLPPNACVGQLRTSEQLQVELLRALAGEATLIVMDEVTAALTSDESERLFSIVRSLNAEGRTVVYISHFLDEVLTLASSVTVLRDGAVIRTGPTAVETAHSLITAMLGRSIELTYPVKQRPPKEAPTVLSVRGLIRGRTIRDVSFDVRAGEIVSLAGLIGSGRTEVARSVFGADPRDGGEIEVNGAAVSIKRPRDAIRAGLALLPESRKDQGLFMRRSIVENVSLAHIDDVSRGGVLLFDQERERVRGLTESLDVRAAGLGALVETLSGGNQQKVLFAKWLFRTPRVLIADEPTKGVDVGAKHAIHELIARLASEGMGVLLISSEIEEVLGLSHRILVMRYGSLVAEFDGATATETEVMNAAFGAAERAIA
jgi:ABC-type sugar transport system ATPase subunit